ncbi:S-layer protein [Thermococcus paralvinellae]|uniref:S-layer protein outer domain-containing protein n=1 Tax=Thermococcus paralvinellae TaxID=582419 RepID=W0I731_9EURY|nr:S-layer protein [Thermococcus paralvinellae]AHF80527.1 Hypothetical protein TES1_1143 [Thermococcus paralvinellae]
MHKTVLILVGLILLSQLTYGMQEKPEVIVEINPNLELFAVVYILAFNGSDYFIIAPQSYVKDVLTYFAPYREHEAVYLIREAFPRDLSLYVRDDSIMSWSNQLSSLPYLGNESEDDPLLSDMLRALVSFAKESNFMKFYNAHREEYEKAVSPLRELFGNEFPEKFREFFGYIYENYRIEFSYSLKIHPHSWRRYDTLYYIGTALQNLNNFSIQFQAITAFHEFSHQFINPVMQRNLKLFENVSYYLSEAKNEFPILTTYDMYHFSSEYAYFAETLTEAFAVYLAMNSNISPAVVKYRVLWYSSWNFPLLEDFVKEYENFEKIKKPNETFEDYLPTLAEHMHKWATPGNITDYFKQKVPVTSKWAVDRAYYMGKIIIVYGTQNPLREGNEYDKETAFELKDTLEKRFKGFYPQKPTILIKADTNLTDEDLKQNLLLIGGPAANKITEKLASKLPISFIFNETWRLRRAPVVVNKFEAFFVRDSIKELSLNEEIPEEYPLGVIEVIRNPWNGENFIILIAGIDRYSTRKMARKFYNVPSSYVIIGKTHHEIGFYMQR